MPPASPFPGTKRFMEAKSLYRRILRLHRTSLNDPAKKALGDLYVKKEFRIHCADPFSNQISLKGSPTQTLNPPTEEQWRMFLRAWTQYADQISQGEIGIKMSRQQKSSLSREQQMKLKELRDSIKGK